MTLPQWEQCSDVELVVAALVGNMGAFDELVIRYQSAMRIVAQQIVGNYEAAEDVVQEALLLAFKALPQLDDLNRFDSWLYSITRHRAMRYLKEAGRQEPTSELDEVLLENSNAVVSNPAQLMATTEVHNDINNAISQLPAECQEVLKLYYWEDMPQQKIAELLDLSLTMVKWRLRKAKKMLKASLKMKALQNSV